MNDIVNRERKERWDELDVLKGIGIILVLFGHLPINNEMHILIYSFHMPLFFFCSGIFFKRRTLKENMIKDIRTILIPYLFFAFVLILTLMMLSVKHTYDPISSLNQLNLSIFDRQCYPLYHTIWFLVCMFFVKEMFNAFCKSQIQGLFIGGGNYCFHPAKKWHSSTVFYRYCFRYDVVL